MRHPVQSVQATVAEAKNRALSAPMYERTSEEALRDALGRMGPAPAAAAALRVVYNRSVVPVGRGVSLEHVIRSAMRGELRAVVTLPPIEG